MASDKTIAVNFSQEAATSQVLSHPNLISSHQAGWKGMYLEYHNSPSHETPEHYPIQHVIAIQTEGLVHSERRLDGQFRREQIGVGDVCIVPAHAHHWIRSHGEQGLLLLSLEPDFVKRVVQEAINPDRVEILPHFSQPDPLIHQLGRSLKTSLQSDPLGSRFYVESLGVALVAHLVQHYAAIPLQAHSNSVSQASIERAIEYIDDHLTEDLSLEAIATVSGLSQYYFSRMFKQVTRRTPWQYVVQQRIELAKRLLAQPQWSIAQISQHLGIANQAQFTNFFRKHSGVTPTQYRQGR